jgi:hypothetical protein
MSQRIATGFLAAAAIGLLIAGCGGSPVAPPPPPPPPPVNQPPRIESVTPQKERVEVDEEISVTAVVTDAETPVDQLRFEWQADAGTFTGQGPAVRWRSPRGPQTPADYVLNLTVTETYGVPDAAGVRPQNQVKATSAIVRVHDSPKELGDMSMRFLTDFANSSVPADVAVREFSDSCSGKPEEQGQIADNRIKYQILSSQLRLNNVTVASGSTRANMTVSCEFWSRIKQCTPDVKNCVVGSTEHVDGKCLLTGVYETRRWWLCTSNFEGDLLPSMRAFFGRR